jgi:GntR family transcriptional regulator
MKTPYPTKQQPKQIEKSPRTAVQQKTAPKAISELTQLVDDGASPLYRQVKRTLLKLIESGRYRPGQTLPNEADLSKALHVSIGTLRKAVEELVHEHILVRRQGKGTFVALHNYDRFLFQFFHVQRRPEPDAMPDAAMQERDMPVVDTVRFEQGKCTEDEAHLLRLRKGDAVLRIDNRLSLGGAAVVHDRITLPEQLYKGLSLARLEARSSTLYNLYQTDYGITVLRAQERARAAACNADVARILGLRTGQPVIEVHRLAVSFGEKPVEYRVSSIDTSAHDYVNTLSKPR